MIKKIKIYSLLVLSLLFVFTSCKDDENVPAPKAGFTLESTTIKAREVISPNNTSENGVTYQWSLGNGKLINGESPSFSYDTEGSYILTLVVQNESGSSKVQQTVTVSGILPIAGFDVENSDRLIANGDVVFVNTSEDGVTYEWDFGDGNTSTDANPVHRYQASGVYTVTLIATNEDGTNEISQDVTIRTRPNELYFMDPSDFYLRRTLLGSDVVTQDVVEMPGWGVGVSFNPTDGMVYITDADNTSESVNKIWRLNPDGSGLEELVGGLTEPWLIDVDGTAGYMFWTDFSSGDVMRANLDGSDAQTIATYLDGFEYPEGIAAFDGSVYLNDPTLNGILKVSYDGSTVEQIITDMGGIGIGIDKTNSMIYFHDQNSGAIKRSDLSGNVDTEWSIALSEAGDRVYGISVDVSAGKIYWTNRDSGLIGAADLNGENIETLAGSLNSPRGLTLIKNQ
ncbi:PKD domain-containing protein [Marinigracilibium pacificum]|uniref:PKD domain-containing protein n=1 Tax=Marinigracilibium pacificum TaxID=2729599 RepID=A0A848J745_9BACT|nr:PKD domain-containing protein [Marinigracilibium pacificum]NMM48932.1 PKD domain-containing protein [Marinigracilibium pacificum]